MTTTTTAMDWPTLLRAVNEYLFELDDDFGLAMLAEEAPERLAARWLGSPGASDDTIAARERALGVALPPDYREFLRTSNGWVGLAGFLGIDCSLLPVEQIDWFRPLDATVGRGDAILAVAAATGLDAAGLDAAALDRALLIGESDGNACVLLVASDDPDPRWQVWRWHPETGLDQEPSFRALMETGLR